MNVQPGQRGEWWNSPILERLVNAPRRWVLAILVNRSGAVGERELAVRLAAADRSKSLEDVTDEEAAKKRIHLRHSHLPALSDVDLVVWDRDDRTATTTDHPALEDPRLRYLLEKRDPAWDELMSALVVERQRLALAVLEAHDGPMTKSALAWEVAVREEGTRPSADDVEETLLALHHVHLPKLQATGLIEYDDETVTYGGSRELAATWFDIRPDESRRVDPQRRTA